MQRRLLLAGTAARVLRGARALSGITAAPLRRHTALAYVAALLVLLVAIATSMAVGRYPVSPGELLDWLAALVTGRDAGLSPTADTVIREIRGPRVLAALVVGGALAASGTAYQTLFRNPLVAPDILGVSSGAALGAVLAIFLSRDILTIQIFAFGGGLAAVAIVSSLAAAVRASHDTTLALVLTGIVVSALFGAIVSLLKVLADPYQQLPAITFWLLGSLAGVDRTDVLGTLPAIVLGIAPLWLLRWRINALAAGEDEARSLGIDVRRLRVLVIVGATLATASAVAIAGTIGWVGLLVPHAARFIVGPVFARLLPMSVLLGMVFLLLVDTLARSASAVEVPLGVLTALVGTPLFIGLLFRTRRSGS